MRVMPDIHAVRPPVCPHCSALSLGRNGRVVLEGHGQRRRDVVVPAYDGGLTFKRISCWSRRFLCNACGRGSTILPEGVIPGCLYSLAAIAVAWFAASTAMGTSASRSSPVCAPEGADRGAASTPRWRTPYRWSKRIETLLPTCLLVPDGWRSDVERVLLWLLPRAGELDALAVGRAAARAHSVAQARHGTAM